MLRRANRLRRQSDFRQLHARGKTIATSAFVVKFSSSRQVVSRIGIVVGSKVSKHATVRNRLRRRIREIARRLLPGLSAGYDIVIIARPTAVRRSFAEINSELSLVSKKLEPARRPISS